MCRCTRLGGTPSGPRSRACRSAHGLSVFACKNPFAPLLWGDPNQPVNVAAGRCTRATLVRVLHRIDRATCVTAKTPPRQSGCANKKWRRSLKRRKSRPRPAADSAEILPSNTASRSLPACSRSARSALLARFGIAFTACTLEHSARIRYEQRCRLHSVCTMQLGSSDRADPRLFEQGGRTCACCRCRHAATAGTYCATVHRVPRGPECITNTFQAVRTPLGVVCADCVRVPLRGRMPNGPAGVYGDFHDRRRPSDLARRERCPAPERRARGLRSRCAHFAAMSVATCL
jgi:hypothetical protein